MIFSKTTISNDIIFKPTVSLYLKYSILSLYNVFIFKHELVLLKNPEQLFSTLFIKNICTSIYFSKTKKPTMSGVKVSTEISVMKCTQFPVYLQNFLILLKELNV